MQGPRRLFEEKVKSFQESDSTGRVANEARMNITTTACSLQLIALVLEPLLVLLRIMMMMEMSVGNNDTCRLWI